MSPSTTFGSNYNFIELNRTFHEFSESDTEFDDLDIRQSFHFGERLSWPNLIKEYRLIILSEAGSGKTFEIRNIAHFLRAQERPAFFLRLEYISRDFEVAFEVGTYDEFGKWLKSGEEGWLLLDSVDEARLRGPGDFELAIRKLSKLISTAKERTHIIITGRTTAWRPQTDLVYCTNHLPYSVATTAECEQQAADDNPSNSVLTKTKKNGETQSVFKIIALDNLTREQIAVFVKARGVENSDSFLDAIERADAWSFTSRPQDLQELVDFWIDKGQIGTRLEIMRNSINRRLVERDQSRAEAHPLSVEHARQGARLLAAATTLTQNPTIMVPDGAENSKGIAIQTVLSDWNEKDQSTLLSRPIFDDAIYSTVRFHHRSVREYLTAEWFAELLNHETSRRNIETLFFRNQYDLDIITPTLRPILPWLAILDEKIREQIRKVAPEIIFEGGDPCQLPLEVRRYILREVCEQMANGTTGRSMRDYAAVQRFASLDLTDDIRTLIQQYANNEDLVAYLLRMIWLGQLVNARPEAMTVALKPTADEYTRITAFRAVKAIGSDEDQDCVRQCLLVESSVIKRKWLAELIEGIQPTKQTLLWLLACLEKCEAKEPYAVDYLIDGVTKFAENADIKLIPQIIVGLNKLLNNPPVIERRFCEISNKFLWLMPAACKAVERLILAHDPNALESDTLTILHKYAALRGYQSYELNEIKTDFSKLVPAWKELNRTLFWFEVTESRLVIDQKPGERLTDFRRVSTFGSLWRFGEDDFEYVTEQISRKSFIDDRLVALSLACHLYSLSKRQRAWLTTLKKLVAGNDELSESLQGFLHPPKESHRWKKQEAEWKRRAAAEQKKKENNQAEWKKYLNENIDKLREDFLEKPGTLTNALLYLYNQTRNEKDNFGRWTDYNWKALIPAYGEAVAHFFRDAAVSFWRHYKPKLRSEGAPFNETPYAVIFGLTGIEIEANEIKSWPENLNSAEIERACRYASFELNGFPTWFPKLFEMYPKIVCDFLMREIYYELSLEKPDKDTHYIIGDISWSGQWSWNQMAPSIYELLKAKEPKNLSNLRMLLKIIQGSDISDDIIKDLAHRKCYSIKKLAHLAHWFAVWSGVAPDDAIATLQLRIGKITIQQKRTLFSMMFVTNLLGSHRDEGASVRNAFKTPAHLKTLYLLMHKYIKSKEDIDRAGKGVYTPDLRDNAQDARNKLFELLNKIPGKESFLALKEIANKHPEESSRPWIMHYAKTKAEQDGDIEPWLPSQVREFHEIFERTPRNHKELAELAVLRFLDLKDDLENGDSSIASILKNVSDETEIRKYLGQTFRDKALRRYSVPQEEELADAKRPDLRFHGVEFDGPVPVELKLADRWTGPELFERIENQLCGDYLRDNRSNRGIFVLVYRGEKSGWDVPNRSNRVDFAGLTVALQNYWQDISPKFPNVDNITIIGIDLTKRSSY